MSHIEPIHSRLADDPILGEIVALFVDEMPARIATLRNHLAGADWDGLRRTAHQLKGAMGSHGFDQITLAARRLEEAAGASESEEAIRSTAEELISLCGRMTATPAEKSIETDVPEATR